MVGYDAFYTGADPTRCSRRQVFSEATFTAAGLQIIKKTRRLEQIIARNAASPSTAFARFTYGPERRSRWARWPHDALSPGYGST